MQKYKTSISSMPPEILVSIFILLDFRTINALKATCRSFLLLLREFQIISYYSLLEITSSANNESPLCILPPLKRLEILKRREEGWRMLDVGWEERIPVQHESSAIYDLTGGIYILGSMNKKVVHWCRLPSGPADNPTKWNKIVIPGEHLIVDIGLNIDEHDLIAVVTSTPSENLPSHHILSIHLFSLSRSTGDTCVPHPHAKMPLIRICETPFPHPSICIEIVGPHLVLTTSYPFNPFQPDDHLYVLEWKSGRTKMHISAAYHTYLSFVFLDETRLLVPNTRKDCLDIWRIPKEGEGYLDEEHGGGRYKTSVVPERSLGLPELTDEHYIASMFCRGELNPGVPSSHESSTSTSTSTFSTSSAAAATTATTATTEDDPLTISLPYSSCAFHAHPKDAIIIFNIRMQRFGIGGSMTFTMFIHRSSLLALCPEQGREDECVRWPLGHSRYGGGNVEVAGWGPHELEEHEEGPEREQEDEDDYDYEDDHDHGEAALGFFEDDDEEEDTSSTAGASNAGPSATQAHPQPHPQTQLPLPTQLPPTMQIMQLPPGVHGVGGGAPLPMLIINGTAIPIPPALQGHPQFQPQVQQQQPSGNSSATTNTNNNGAAASGSSHNTHATHATPPALPQQIPHLLSIHGPEVIPWEEWNGPGVSRWFVSEEMPTRWITTSCGQRAVVCGEWEGGGEQARPEEEDGKFEQEGSYDAVLEDVGGANVAAAAAMNGSATQVDGVTLMDGIVEGGRQGEDEEPGMVIKVLDFSPLRIMKEEAEQRRREEEAKLRRGREVELALEERWRDENEQGQDREAVGRDKGKEKAVDVGLEVDYRAYADFTSAAYGSTNTHANASTPSTGQPGTAGSRSSLASSTLTGVLSTSPPTVITQPSRLAYTVFKEPVESWLPYSVVETRKVRKFDGVLMDEERLVGLITDEEDVVKEVWVLGMGESEREGATTSASKNADFSGVRQQEHELGGENGRVN